MASPHPVYTWGDNYVILLTTVIATMLEVFSCCSSVTS